MLSLANIPQSQIGLFQFYTNKIILLTNRPLSYFVIILENDNILKTIQKNKIYIYTELFVIDMLRLYKNSFFNNLTAVYNTKDCQGQIAVEILLRILLYYYIEQKYCNGPYYFQFTDFYKSNIFINKY